MKHIDFTRPGGFPLEQETLSRLQQAYKDEFFAVFQRHLGITPDQNYLLAHATATERGWLILQGTLVSIAPEANPTPYVQVTERREALIFRSGIRHKVYITYDAVYVDAMAADEEVTNEQETRITRYYALADLQTLTNIPDLGNIYLALDGSSPMSGNLDLGGNRISELNVDDSTEAVLRTGELYFGSKDQRGTLHPDSPQGRVMVDEGNALSINHRADWEQLQIHGQVGFPGLKPTASDDRHPVIIDENGQLTRSNGTFIGSVPIGMIALWSHPAIPTGWILCDGYFGRIVNGFNIPDMSAQFFDDVRYIMHVGDFNIYPIVNAGADQLIQLATGEATLAGTVEDLDGSIASYLWSYTSQPPGLPATFSTPDRPVTDVTGLQGGVYTFQLTATDNEGASSHDEVQVRVNRPPQVTISGNTRIRLVNDNNTGATTLTAHVVDPDSDTPNYQWYDSAGTPLTTSSKLALTGLGYGNQPIKAHRYRVRITDGRGGVAELWQEVLVAKIQLVIRSKEEVAYPNTSVTLGVGGILSNPFSTPGTTDDMTILWTQEDSNAPAVITNSDALIAQVTGLRSGLTYKFRILVRYRDGLGVYGYTDVEVKDNPNTKPVVNSISIGSSSATVSQLTANTSDSDGDAISTYVWTVPAAITNPGNVKSFSVDKNNLLGGKYTFSVYVIDARGKPSDPKSTELNVLKMIVSGLQSNDNGGFSNFNIVLNGPPRYEDIDIEVTVNSNGSLRVSGGFVFKTSAGATIGTTISGRSAIIRLSQLSGTGSNTIPFVLNAITYGSSTASFSFAGITRTVIARLNQPTCFDLQSDVPLAGGGMKKLEQIEVGDQLLALDFPNRIDADEGDYQQWAGNLPDAKLATVTVKHKSAFTSDHYYEIILLDETVIKVTEGHPLMAGKEQGQEVCWIKPLDLHEGMFLVDGKAGLKTIRSIVRKTETLQVGVLDVESIDNFVLGGVVVHNAEITIGGSVDSGGPIDIIDKH